MINSKSGSYPLPLVLIFAIFTAVLGFWGWQLAHIAFTQPPPASQVYAAVFVRNPSAHVGLTAEIFPDTPWNDRLTITVTGATGKNAGWLLLIECPAGAPSLSHAVHLYSETAPQIQSQTSQATVYSGVTAAKHSEYFGCFSQDPPSPGAPGYPPSLGNVSLPALQTDQAIEVAQAAPIMYAQQSRPGGSVGHLFQIFPGAVCPTATAVPVPSASSATAPATAGNSPSPSQQSASASPSTSPSPSAAPSPGCYQQTPAGARFIPYDLPASVNTTETLNRVSIQGYQVNSMFPVATTANEPGEQPGQTARESITWTGLSGLSPSLDVTNTAAEVATGHDTFWAGILVGAAAGFAVTFIDKISDVTGEWWKKWRGKESSTEAEAAAAQHDQSRKPDREPPAEGGEQQE